MGPWGLHPRGAAQMGDEREGSMQVCTLGDDTTREKREEKVGHEGEERGVNMSAFL